MVRVRFAPSPTGYLHIGNARTALFNWLFAKKYDGAFILRIEDTDVARTKESYIQQIMSDLRWLRIDWDEGPDKGGPYGPYRQSDRLKHYIKFAEKLLSEGKVYHCYCSEAQLEARRKEALKRGETPGYDNRCRELSKREVSAYIRQGIKPCLRLKVPARTIVVDDLIRGKVSFDLGLMGDFVIMKSNQSPAFNFAVCVDDYLMKISHIIRGEDHLSNTPRHLLIFDALGVSSPKFAHMSLTLGPDGNRLSKRHGATSIAECRSLGYLPEAIVNYLALLGFSPGGESEILSIDELIQAFEIERMTRSKDLFDQKKLDWIGGAYIRSTDLDRLTNLAIGYLKRDGRVSDPITQGKFEWLRQMVEAVKDHLTHLSEISDYADTFFEEYPPITKDAEWVLKASEAKTILKNLRQTLSQIDEVRKDNFKDVIKEVGQLSGAKGKDLYLPIRAALTGKLHGPELKLILPILGKERSLTRIDRILKG